MASPGHWHGSAMVYIRIIALSIAFYDYILTLPAEWRFYKGQRSWRLSPGCILFIAIRYTSILALVTSAIGFFGHFFTDQSCAKYYMIPPVLKVVQTLVSQMILGIRTINISRRAPWVIWTIAVSFIGASVSEGVLNLSNRVPLKGSCGNCTAGDTPPHLTVWLFYVLAIVYDLLTLCISTLYLLDISPNSGKLGRLVKIMLADGLVYFVALTGVNILNLILYRSTDEEDQTSGVALGYALTWIMSQRILIHLRGTPLSPRVTSPLVSPDCYSPLSSETLLRSPSINCHVSPDLLPTPHPRGRWNRTDAAAAHNRTQIIVSRQLPSAHSISHAMRSQFESKERAPLSTGFDLGGWSMASSYPRYSETTEGKTSSACVYSGDVESQTQSQSQGQGRRSGAMARDTNSEFESGVLVQVQIEETVTVEFDPQAFMRESYRTPRVMWGHDRERVAAWGQDVAPTDRLSTGDSRREQGAEERAMSAGESEGAARR
ncbi:hypothetical protein GSI_10829 [Ganoderma sinense ZZ0214-1]|uniref:DUF6533 domain-containing protein n=1 Tax=Ganoderma sinense ZZ0214-1 TaxID=1077348 RepID=A0A2G8S1Q9_9APHY|nr:hypothetical protein GSI_10829 [Ganoderma sinense ZZ0214-1]